MKFTIIFIFTILSCTRQNNDHGGFDKPIDTVLKNSEKLEFAKGFTIQKKENSTIITVFDPWNNYNTLATYLLVKNAYDSAKYAGQADFVVCVPLSRIATLSLTSVGMLNMLGAAHTISASTDARLIYDSVLYSRFLSGSLTNLGEGTQINTELIVAHKPNLILKYIYGGREVSDEKLIAAGLPIAYNLEFMEKHPLGRSEWIKFVAAFIGKEQLADSLFNQIKLNYIELANKTQNLKHKPKVLDGSSYKGIWYAASGNSYPAKLYADAGADYLWKSDSGNGSLNFNFETIIEKQSQAEYWFGVSSATRKELITNDSRYQLLRSFKLGNVYYFGKRCNPNGGIDYFETGVVRPDVLLKDIISVLHPELTEPHYQQVFLAKVN